MDSHKKIRSSVSGVYSAAEELNDSKCVICYLELPEPMVQTTCGHRFCRDCMMRYDLNVYRVICILYHNCLSLEKCVVDKIPIPLFLFLIHRRYSIILSIWLLLYRFLQVHVWRENVRHEF